jgi:hypothetical protein
MEQQSVLKIVRRAMADEALSVCSAAALAAGRLRDPEAPKAFKQAVLALAGHFDQKKIGDRMHYTDFEAHLDAAAAMATGIAASKDAGCAPALELSLQRLLLAPIEVQSSERAGQNASIPRRKLASAMVEACAALDAPNVRPVLESLASHGELGVAERAREILASLSR